MERRTLCDQHHQPSLSHASGFLEQADVLSEREISGCGFNLPIWIVRVDIGGEIVNTLRGSAVDDLSIELPVRSHRARQVERVGEIRKRLCKSPRSRFR